MQLLGAELQGAVANVLNRATTLPCQNALARSIFHQAASSALVLGCAGKRSTSCGGMQRGRGERVRETGQDNRVTEGEERETQILVGRLFVLSNCQSPAGAQVVQVPVLD